MKPSQPTGPAGPSLQLSQLTPFGAGGRRLCFVHPLDPSKCVKVLRPDTRKPRSGRGLIPGCLRRAYDNNAHEFTVLTELFDRIGPAAAQCLPRCHGWTETDLGKGLMLDLIRDRDGGISRNLRELITTGTTPATFRPAYEELAAFLTEHTVLTRALLDHNIAAQNLGEGRWRLFIIDGLGDPAWIPFGRWIEPRSVQKAISYQLLMVLGIRLGFRLGGGLNRAASRKQFPISSVNGRSGGQGVPVRSTR